MTLSDRLRKTAASLKSEIKVYQIVLRDPRTPICARCLLGFAVGYLMLPIDLIPDFIPVIGHLDDALVVPCLIWLAFRMIPREVLDDNRRKAASL